MKIAILLETGYAGGGCFTHSINSSLEMIKYFNSKDKIIVYTQIERNVKILKDLKIPVIFFKNSFLDKILINILAISFFRFFLSFFNFQISLEKILIKEKTDFIFFPVESKTIYSLKKIRFIFSLLDLEHWKHSIYPEITKNDYQRREDLYFYSLEKSSLVVTNHDEIKKKICNYYKTNKAKITVIPYTQNNIFKKKQNKKKHFLKKYQSINNYFFYPAQIWGHKNHITIIKAAKILKTKNYKVNFIFSGKDRGYKKNLDKFIIKNKLKNIIFTGFLSNEEMDYIYKNCKGVIFTSHFGPNTLVSLEAWSYNKPLIYNKKLKDCPKGTAVLVDAKKPELVSNAIQKIMNNNYNKKFKLNGRKQLKLIHESNKNGYKLLKSKLSSIINNNQY